MFLVLVPIAALILYRVGRSMKQATRRVLERMSNIYKVLHESFEGIQAGQGVQPRGIRTASLPHGDALVSPEVDTSDHHRGPGRPRHLDPGSDCGGRCPAGGQLPGPQSQDSRYSTSRWPRLRWSRRRCSTCTCCWRPSPIRVRKLASVFTRLAVGATRRPIGSFVLHRPAPERVVANSDGLHLERVLTGCRRRKRPGSIRRAPIVVPAGPTQLHRVPRGLLPACRGEPILSHDQPVHQGRRDDRRGGSQRQRQEYPAGAAAAILRPRPRQRLDQRHGFAEGQPAEPAPGRSVW